MDEEFLARIIGELILDNDTLNVPGLGTFVAESMPASFSDRGDTVNPPYRRLSFTAGSEDDGKLVGYIASEAGIDAAEATAIVGPLVDQMHAQLIETKSVELPGLGRLRATRENHFFFVPDPSLDISPEACGLVPVSIRPHKVAMPSLAEAQVTSPIADSLQKAIADGTLGAETLASNAAAESASPTEPAAAEGASPAADSTETLPVDDAAGAIPSPEDAAGTPATATESHHHSTEHHHSGEHHSSEHHRHSGEHHHSSEHHHSNEHHHHGTHHHSTPSRGLSSGWRATLWTLAAAVVLLGAFTAVSRIFPGSTDRLLYTQEQLSIINAPENGTGLPG